MVLAAALATGLLGIAACSSVTAGSGRVGTQSRTQSGADFPSSGSAPGSSAAPSPTTPGTPATSAGATGSPGSQVIPAPETPVKTIQVHGTAGTFTVQVWARQTGKDCAEHAYGSPVIKYLGAHPCASMTRLLATTTVGGRAVGFAQESVTFAGGYPQMYTYAGKFRALVTKDGTGNINDLMREGYRLPSGPASVPYPNAFNAQFQDAVTTVVEAWYLDGSTPDNDPALVQMEQDCFLQVY
jgi:hypothetical protein